jgi:arylsulfatase A-like enzyme
MKKLLVVAAVLFVVASLDQATAESRPNFLIFHTDDQRADTVTCYDKNAALPTPNIDGLAERGVRFTNAYVTTPICAVSRATLLSGRYARNTRVHEFVKPIPPDIWKLSYPALLSQAGYFVGQLGKFGVGVDKTTKATFDFFDASIDQGPPFRDYQGKKLHDAEWLTRRTSDFLDAVPEGKPFVLQVNYKEPHGSSVPAPEDDALLDEKTFPRLANETAEANARLPEFVRQAYGGHCYNREVNLNGDNSPYLRNYFEKIHSVDRSIGAIMEDLRKRGLAENTVVIYLSDHGIHFGEKLLGGKWTPYEESIRIPFIVEDPRLPEDRRGTTNSDLVLNIDVAPTLLAMAGAPAPESMDGVSLVPLLEGKKVAWRDHFFFEHRVSNSNIPRPIPRNIGVRGLHTKFFRWTDLDPVVEVMHDLTKDPTEDVDVLNDPAYAEERIRLTRLLDQWLEANPDTYEYDSYGRRPQSGAPEIDWEKFKSVRPEEYARIAAEIEKLGVTWDQAVKDKIVRAKISAAARYWY